MNRTVYRAIDPAILMESACDPVVFQALSQTYLDHAPAIFQQLCAALAKGDLTMASRQAHSLKGMTMLIGASELTTRLQEIETAGRAGRPCDQSGLAELFALVLDEVGISMSDEGLG